MTEIAGIVKICIMELAKSPILLFSLLIFVAIPATGIYFLVSKLFRVIGEKDSQTERLMKNVFDHTSSIDRLGDALRLTIGRGLEK